MGTIQAVKIEDADGKRITSELTNLKSALASFVTACKEEGQTGAVSSGISQALKSEVDSKVLGFIKQSL